MICEHLDWWYATPGARLIIVAPPRHGKSELVSRRLPAYILGRNPDASIIATSYGADLASRMNRDVQRVMDHGTYSRLFPESRLFGKNIRTMASGTWMRNSDLFEVVGHKGSYRSAGIGGGITGMGFDFGIMDDPIKSAAEAASATMRESIWEWYISTFYTRQHKGARILLTLTRWHHDDLAGRLLKLMEEDPQADQWRVLHLPALAHPKVEEELTEEQGFRLEMNQQAAAHDLDGWHVTRSVYSDWLQDHGRDMPASDCSDPRADGEALWPLRFPKEWLEQTKATLGPYQFGAIYDGNPTPREGGLFTEASLSRRVEACPVGADVERVRSWDKGYSSHGDYSVGVRMSRNRDGIFVIEDVIRIRATPKERNRIIKETAVEDDRLFGKVEIRIEEPPGAGSETTANLISELAGHNARAHKPKGDKEERAEGLSAQADAGNVWLVRGAWNRAFVAEMIVFPGGENDDQVDAATQAFLYLCSPEPDYNIHQLRLDSDPGENSSMAQVIKYPQIRGFNPYGTFQGTPLLDGQKYYLPDFRTQSEAAHSVCVFYRELGSPVPDFGINTLEPEQVAMIEAKVKEYIRQNRLTPAPAAVPTVPMPESAPVRATGRK